LVFFWSEYQTFVQRQHFTYNNSYTSLVIVPKCLYTGGTEM